MTITRKVGWVIAGGAIGLVALAGIIWLLTSGRSSAPKPTGSATTTNSVTNVVARLAAMQRQVAELQRAEAERHAETTSTSPELTATAAAPEVPAPTAAPTKTAFVSTKASSGGGSGTALSFADGGANIKRVVLTADIVRDGQQSTTATKTTGRPVVEIRDDIKDFQSRIREKETTMGLVRENLNNSSSPSQNIILRANIADLKAQIEDMKEKLADLTAELKGASRS